MDKGTFFVRLGGPDAPAKAFPFDVRSPDFLRQKLRFVSYIRRHKYSVMFVTLQDADGNWHVHNTLNDAFSF